MEICIIDNCLKTVKAKRLCAMHHQRLIRHGDPEIVKPRRVKTVKVCEWANCQGKVLAKGYCSKHYYIQRVTGKE
ncbi:hypothetical protein [Paenibacillus sp. HB172176]|uniref:hypothetical protein n=1 Tax=Paenibacillus sp. HB172176 TaxID=2493690 RepID=UPI0014388EB0|nr:hypothetical protein [Paenibacillus sp. HB172176]